MDVEEIAVCSGSDNSLLENIDSLNINEDEVEKEGLKEEMVYVNGEKEWDKEMIEEIEKGEEKEEEEGIVDKIKITDLSFYIQKEIFSNFNLENDTEAKTFVNVLLVCKEFSYLLEVTREIYDTTLNHMNERLLFSMIKMKNTNGEEDETDGKFKNLKTLIYSTARNNKLKLLCENVKGIEELKLQHSIKLTDDGIECLSNLDSLKMLDLSRIKSLTSDAIEYISENVPSLKSLKLRMCSKLDDSIMVHLSKLNLTYLDISGINGIRGIKWKEGSFHLEKLEHLNISSCNNITGRGLHDICLNVPNLLILNLSNCLNVTDLIIKLLSIKLLDLQELILFNCIQITDNSISYLQTMSNIQTLNISRTNISNESYEYFIEGFTNLTNLNTAKSKLTPDILESLKTDRPNLAIIQ
eukprot:TRINITY_DN2455_c0_g4_i1.p1 TRINITY_DN2455_c0_g4~~TRINITY_DN2455_c0_g4_i1.p1  ORF type:complete len:412 (-),score=75.95 TRINITY_DN2455_c0_g4_i1:870-2105(-)